MVAMKLTVQDEWERRRIGGEDRAIPGNNPLEPDSEVFSLVYSYYYLLSLQTFDQRDLVLLRSQRDWSIPVGRPQLKA